jgi:hypothetical protein
MRFSQDTIRELYKVALSNKLFETKDLFKDTHKGGVAPSYVLDHWIIENENDKAYTEYKFNASRVPIGSLMVQSQVTDKVYWEQDIKIKKKHSYSIEALINLTIVEMASQKESTNQKQVNMEKDQIALPDGEHIIDGKVYIVKGGVVVEVKDVTDGQEKLIEDNLEKSADENLKAEDKPKEDEKLAEEKPKEEEKLAEDKPKEELAEDKPKEEKTPEEMMKDGEEKPKEEMAEDKPKEESSEIANLQKQIEDLVAMVAELKTQIESKPTEEVPVEMTSQKQPLYKSVMNLINNK